MFNIQCAFIIREQRAFFEQKVWVHMGTGTLCNTGHGDTCHESPTFIL